MLRTIARRAAHTTETVAPKTPPLPFYTNLYQTKKIWPPNYKELTFQEKLRFEKKYKRRVALATARPRWTKLIKLLQLSTTIVILSWIFFFSEIQLLGEKYRPNERIRHNFRTLWDAFNPETRYDRPLTAPKPPPPREKPHPGPSETTE